ncbi:SlyX family protein [Thiomicrorhabdus heinhorstiae]|uniref:SlyX family protein n=1 Tax=Thiomicrorhabdus heinhorstiae TaxID=2748010 RepID=A0ABS0BSP6_9GAMM|nr:SlyX family protein [Thiomicrorhabdus heinhorstiae]MBF6056872.1 SlyX family protein [Thiomicrorhabdus heinhorstiae]
MDLNHIDGSGESQEIRRLIESLQIEQAYHHDSIEAIEKTLLQQHQQIQQLQTQLKLLSEYLKTLREEAIRNPADEAPPPHY